MMSKKRNIEFHRIFDLLLLKDVQETLTNPSAPKKEKRELENLMRSLNLLKDSVNSFDEKGLSPLMKAAFLGQSEIAEFLIKNLGANPNLQDEYGQTALHICADSIFVNETDNDIDSADFKKTLETLIVNGANPSIKDEGGKTAAYYSSINGVSPDKSTLIDIDLINEGTSPSSSTGSSDSPPFKRASSASLGSLSSQSETSPDASPSRRAPTEAPVSAISDKISNEASFHGARLKAAGTKKGHVMDNTPTSSPSSKKSPKKGCRCSIM